MEIKEAFIRSVIEVFSLFRMKAQFLQEEEQSFLSSADQVNILNSFSHALKGNIVFGFSRSRALKIASLSKGQEVFNFDMEAKNAIGELTTLAMNLAISKFKAVNSIYISPPVLITGDEVFLMISGVKTTKLLFQLNNEDLLSVAYCIEESIQAV